MKISTVILSPTKNLLIPLMLLFANAAFSQNVHCRLSYDDASPQQNKVTVEATFDPMQADDLYLHIAEMDYFAGVYQTKTDAPLQFYYGEVCGFNYNEVTVQNVDSNIRFISQSKHIDSNFFYSLSLTCYPTNKAADAGKRKRPDRTCKPYKP